MLLKYLMNPELIERPELWLAMSDGEFLVEDYECQLQRNVEFAVSWFDWSSEERMKKCIDTLGWRYITHHCEDHEGFVTLEAFFEPEEDSPFKLKCSAIYSVSTMWGEVIDSVGGPAMLHFPNGERRRVLEVSSDCQQGNYDLLKACIELGNLDVSVGYKPTNDCVERVEMYRYRPFLDDNNTDE